MLQYLAGENDLSATDVFNRCCIALLLSGHTFLSLVKNIPPIDDTGW
jgi:hypothetical protein